MNEQEAPLPEGQPEEPIRELQPADDAPAQKEVASSPRPKVSQSNTEERKEVVPSVEVEPVDDSPEPEANRVDYLQLMKDEEDEEKKLELYLRYQ